MKKSILFLSMALLLITAEISAQLGAPEVQSVYGGRINAITGYSTGANSSRIFITTESANTAFYADITNLNSGSATFSAFSVVPALDAAANYGSNIREIAVHENSGYLFFNHDTGLLATHPGGSSLKTAFPSRIDAVIIKDDYMIFTGGPNLFFGTINGTGDFTENAASPLTITASGMQTMYIHPVTGIVYVFSHGTSPTLVKSSDPYNSLSGGTTFTTISLSTLSTSVQWNAFGIAPSGRLFVAGSGVGFTPSNEVQYSDDEVTWTASTSSGGGVSGGNFAFSGDLSSYSVYLGSQLNHSNGTSGNWQGFGHLGFETHANDGYVFVDPTDQNVVYMTTDQGIGASQDMGNTIFEIDDGVEAVQVNDFDMTSDKNTAWLASKSGIRRVTNYTTSPGWTDAIFPNGDGSPYYSVDIPPSNPDICYAGNVRVYKTTDAGSSWMQVFTSESSPYSLPEVWNRVESIEVCPYDENIVFVGNYVEETGRYGGLFYSMDAGSSWDQLYIEASTYGDDVNVYDIVFNLEGADTVAYVGVEYNSGHGRSVYKVVKNGSAWTVSQDMDASTTAVGYAISATIRDLEVSSTGDTIYACGTDVGVNHPIAYYKPLNTTGLWTTLPTSGFPMGTGLQGYAITLGIDTVYCAVENEVYFFPLSGSSWTKGYTYPVGTRINVLYYDELLVGTGTGLYGHLPTGVIPVELTGFSANVVDNEVALRWSTSTETNNSGFEVQRKDDGHGEFRTIAFISGAGNSTTLQSYEYTDRNVNISGTYYYRLKQIDFNGEFTYSNILEISLLQPVAFSLAQNYPNPFNPSTTISFSIPENSKVVLKIFTTMGEEITTLLDAALAAGRYQKYFNVGNLPSGVYMYQLTATDKSGKLRFNETKRMILIK